MYMQKFTHLNLQTHLHLHCYSGSKNTRYYSLTFTLLHQRHLSLS